MLKIICWQEFLLPSPQGIVCNKSLQITTVSSFVIQSPSSTWDRTSCSLCSSKVSAVNHTCALCNSCSVRSLQTLTRNKGMIKSQHFLYTTELYSSAFALSCTSRPNHSTGQLWQRMLYQSVLMKGEKVDNFTYCDTVEGTYEITAQVFTSLSVPSRHCILSNWLLRNSQAHHFLVENYCSFPGTNYCLFMIFVSYFKCLFSSCVMTAQSFVFVLIYIIHFIAWPSAWPSYVLSRSFNALFSDA